MRMCDLCGRKGVRVRRMTRPCGRGRAAFLIEGVPVMSCPHCGEGYLTVETMRSIERIRARWRRIAIPRRIPVATFRGAA